MIIGNIADLQQVDFLKGININFCDAFTYIEENRFEELSVGRVDIGKKDIFGIYQEYSTHEETDGIWEAHKTYLDIQYLISGRELVSIVPLQTLTITKEYSSDLDVVLGKTEIETRKILLNEGDFIILFPNEAHMPSITDIKISKNRKMVIKVPVWF